MEISEGVRPRRTTPSSISIILQMMMRKPNSIIVSNIDNVKDKDKDNIKDNDKEKD